MPEAALRRLIARGLSNEAIGRALGTSRRTIGFWRRKLGLTSDSARPTRPLALRLSGDDARLWPPSLERLMALLRARRTDREIGALYDRGGTAVRNLRFAYLALAPDDQETEFWLRRLFREEADERATMKAIRALCTDRKRERALYAGLRYRDASASALARESFIPGWSWEPRVPNIAARHDPEAVRPAQLRAEERSPAAPVAP